MKKAFVFVMGLAAVVAAVWMAGCATPAAAPQPTPPPNLQVLRVGFAPNYPPLCMAEDGAPAGLEADFARALADELGCPAEIVQMDFGELIPALLKGQVDILMSGLTVTPERAYQMRFCKPYLRNPLVAVARAGWGRAYQSSSHVLAASSAIGVLRHTYAETFAKKHCPKARLIHVSDYDTVPQDLEDNRYSLYVDDLAAVLDLAAKHPATLEIIPFPLQQQEMAWAVHPDNAALLSAANAAVDKWQANGRLDEMLDRWLPDRFR
jgi:ABC-type amino acid transport substrate-binding protein